MGVPFYVPKNWKEQQTKKEEPKQDKWLLWLILGIVIGSLAELFYSVALGWGFCK